MKKGLLIGSGRGIKKEKLIEEIENSDMVIAIDGGMDHLLKNDIRPDLILGDLDSISEEALKEVEDKKIKFLKYPSEKDYTDMELGIEYLKENNFDEIIIFGATGSRLDHTLANIYLLENIDNYGLKGKIKDNNNTIVLVKDFLKLEKKKDYFISVIPIDENGAIVTLKGFKYPLDKYHIEFGSTIGISNEIIDDFAEIKIDSGKVLVIMSKD